MHYMGTYFFCDQAAVDGNVVSYDMHGQQKPKVCQLL